MTDEQRDPSLRKHARMTLAIECIHAVACPMCGGRATTDDCPACLGRGWQWSDGVPPVLCPQTVLAFNTPLPCGRRETCPGCGRTPMEVAHGAGFPVAGMERTR